MLSRIQIITQKKRNLKSLHDFDAHPSRVLMHTSHSLIELARRCALPGTQITPASMMKSCYRLIQDRTVRNKITSPAIIAALINATEY